MRQAVRQGEKQPVKQAVGRQEAVNEVGIEAGKRQVMSQAVRQAKG